MGAGEYDEAEINIGAATGATKREYLSKGGPPPNFSLPPSPSRPPFVREIIKLGSQEGLSDTEGPPPPSALWGRLNRENRGGGREVFGALLSSSSSLPYSPLIHPYAGRGGGGGGSKKCGKESGERSTVSCHISISQTFQATVK